MGELREIKRRVGDLLDELGHDPDEVASSLEAAGVHGVPRSNSSCAVALYTAAGMRADPRIRSVAVGPCTLVLTLVRPDDGRSGGKLVVHLPKRARLRRRLRRLTLPPGPAPEPPHGCGSDDPPGILRERRTTRHHPA